MRFSIVKFGFQVIDFFWPDGWCGQYSVKCLTLQNKSLSKLDHSQTLSTNFFCTSGGIYSLFLIIAFFSLHVGLIFWSYELFAINNENQITGCMILQEILGLVSNFYNKLKISAIPPPVSHGAEKSAGSFCGRNCSQGSYF